VRSPACAEVKAIAEAEGQDERTIREFLQKTAEDFRGKDSVIFRNFSPAHAWAGARNKPAHVGFRAGKQAEAWYNASGEYDNADAAL
jgi:hypothetical protein